MIKILNKRLGTRNALYILFLLLVISITNLYYLSPAFALSSDPGSDPTGKSQRQIIEKYPWIDPTACSNEESSSTQQNTSLNLDDQAILDQVTKYFTETKTSSGAPNGLLPYAKTFVEAGKQYDVDPFLMAAIANFETGRGTSNAFRNKKNAAGISDNRGPKTFNSVEESILAKADLLNRNYIGQELNDIAKIGAKYSPPGASNDPNGTNIEWVPTVSKFYLQASGNKAPSGALINGGRYPGASTTAPQSSTTSVITNNKGYNDQEIFTQEDLAKIEANKPFYIAAASKYDLPWQLLAVIHKRESNLGRINLQNRQGIYQFYGDRNTNKWPPGPVTDENFQLQTDEMARQLREVYLSRNHPSNNGPLSQIGTPDNVIKDILFSYNGRSAKYKEQAKRLGFNDEAQGYEGSPYVMNKADAKRDPATAAPGTWGQVKRDRGPVEYPANKDWGAWVQYTALAGLNSSTEPASDCEESSKIETVSGSGTITAEGYAFPVEPQRKSQHRKLPDMSPLPCTGFCHHTNGNTSVSSPAFDISRAPGGDSAEGAAVYAISDGTIEALSDRYRGNQGCVSMQIKSSKDGYYYYYTHLKNAVVKVGDTVKAGQKVAEIGPRKCANETNPHLHIDRGKIENGQPVKCGGRTSCRDSGMVELMNKIFESLPE